ncbi:hydrogenase maturation nickel metallochaperone HypA [Lutimonas saemankumensis]|uniref:hydrogenase maturation nickel metallochaperone HypA/HybF n=1 Tax=Lutimonas saemankumensis TaxID=483016 RepID=UPI001CD4658E|nr:hydrogenase maturation nickel metallochaperone HypA [Lutimonas saemankumensis]MCA0933363.1 hydrogenase maturation nickel metallochaperone HypA [Lutimonas saemankumensis]
MHELSIVMGILKIAETETKKAGGVHVDSIELEIGTLSGVEMAALDFAWQEVIRDTILENAEKHVTVIPGKAQCMECDTFFELENVYDPCPECNNYMKGIIQGRELRVKALEVS